MLKINIIIKIWIKHDWCVTGDILNEINKND